MYLFDNVCLFVCLLYCRFPEFAPMFKAELFDPDEWADLFKKAGAQCTCVCVCVCVCV